MAEKTIFERIIEREIPAQIVYEDEHCVAFRDTNPQAPVHLLVIPRKPVPAVDAITAEDAALFGHIWATMPKIAQQAGLSGGYRVVVNNGADGGQTVNHLHYHLLGGRRLTWPPG